MSSRYVWDRYTVQYTESSASVDSDSSNAQTGSTRYTGYKFSTLNAPDNSTVAIVGGGCSFSKGKYIITDNPFAVTLSSSRKDIVDELPADCFYAEGSIPVRYARCTFYIGLSTSSNTATQFDSVVEITLGSQNVADSLLHVYLQKYSDELRFSGESSYSGSNTAVIVREALVYSADGTKGSATGTASNAASTAYPPRDNRAKIVIICAIVPLALRRCSRG